MLAIQMNTPPKMAKMTSTTTAKIGYSMSTNYQQSLCVEGLFPIDFSYAQLPDHWLHWLVKCDSTASPRLPDRLERLLLKLRTMTDP
jgi:hypothetical protein